MLKNLFVLDLQLKVLKMKTKSRIEWKSKITGETGHGQWCNPETIDKTNINTLNTRFPEINHWRVDVTVDDIEVEEYLPKECIENFANKYGIIGNGNLPYHTIKHSDGTIEPLICDALDKFCGDILIPFVRTAPEDDCIPYIITRTNTEIDNMVNNSMEKVIVTKSVRCPTCGINFNKTLNSGKFCCSADCYKQFLIKNKEV
jgi:hypothetical protein